MTNAGGKIRVAIVIEGLVGGVRKRIFNVLRNINSDRFALTTILPGSRKGYEAEGDPAEELGRMGMQKIIVPMVRSISPYRDARSFLALRSVFRNCRFDIVHAHCAKAGFLSRLACRAGSMGASVYSPHVFPFQRAARAKASVYKTLERAAARWTDAFIVDSQGEQEVALKLGLAGQERIFVLPDAAPLPEPGDRNARLDVRSEMGTPRDHIVFLSTARVVAYKGIGTLIRAFDRVHREAPKTELWIVGDGEDLKSFEELSRQLGLSAVVRFLGFRRDVYSVTSGCDCFVLVSQAEGSPHSILEALAMEKPIIATDVQGTREFLKNQEHCRLVPWNDFDALAGAMLEYVTNPFSAASLDELPGDWFDPEAQVRKLEQMYVRILEQHEANPVTREAM